MFAVVPHAFRGHNLRCLLVFVLSAVLTAQAQGPTTPDQKAGSSALPAVSNTDPTGQDYKPIHDGSSIHDVNAIGKRDVGCGKGIGNWYSLDKQVAEGKVYSHQVDSTAKMVEDPVVTEYVNRIGQNLVRNSDAKVPFTIKVIDSDELNAFALPGGFFYVNSGIVLAADNEAELASVMAHEIGHVAACHVARAQTRSTIAQLATVPLIFVGGGAGFAAVGASGLLLPVAFLKFSRTFEAQADYLGVQYLYKTGYDPEQFIDFFEKLEAQEKEKPGLMAKTFEDHPPTPDRVAAVQKEIATILPPRDQYVVDTSEFQSVKARLAKIENRHKLQDKKDGEQPTLQRANAGTVAQQLR